ncbi:hypothetical protein MC885_013626 [Smutsia gigantea]|nr:hypothetical protein MC885_013626 [Smutsia gigantea]
MAPPETGPPTSSGPSTLGPTCGAGRESRGFRLPASGVAGSLVRLPRGCASVPGGGDAASPAQGVAQPCLGFRGRPSRILARPALGRPDPGRRPLATTTGMFDIKAWAEYVVEWAAKDPYGFLTTVILALTPLFLASAVLSWKLAKMIEAREKEQKKKQKRQENIAKAKRLKKD